MGAMGNVVHPSCGSPLTPPAAHGPPRPGNGPLPLLPSFPSLTSLEPLGKRCSKRAVSLHTCSALSLIAPLLSGSGSMAGAPQYLYSFFSTPDN